MGSEVCSVKLKPNYFIKVEYLTPITIAVFLDGKLISIIGLNKDIH